MELTTLTSESLQRVLVDPGFKTILVSATWCGACKAFAPIVENIARSSQSPVYKIHVEDNPSGIFLGQKVDMIPTLLFVRNGIVKEKLVGIYGAEEVLAKIKDLSGE